MRKILLSLILIASINNLAFADENTVPAEQTETENLPEDKGFYVGLAYSHLSQDIDHEDKTTNYELDFTAIMLEVGYKFNPYIAIEAKYNVSLGDTDIDDILDHAEVSVLSVFVKPMYPLAPEMDIYVLLGYSLTNAKNAVESTSFDESAFSWGGGASYDALEDISIFAEYTRFYQDTLDGFDQVVDSFNIGVIYRF